MKPRRLKWPIVILVLILAVALAVFLNLPKPLGIQPVDFSAMADGTYTGRCDNGIVAAEVSVTLEAHRITGIALLSHRNGMGGAAEAIVQEVLAQQSLAVDVVTGATYSSQTILKAIENALEGVSP